MPFIQRLVEPINIAQTIWCDDHAFINKPNIHTLPCECSKYRHEYNLPDGSKKGSDNEDNNNTTINSANVVTTVANYDNVGTSLPPMKKLKQHIEFSSTGLSSQRAEYSNASTTSPTNNWRKDSSPLSPCISLNAKRKKSTFEFDSISNITLSNTLRQLASLVLIASDIFDDLQKELQSIGDRAYEVQNKILTMERRIKALDPKLVNIPEGNLLIFAQYKVHYKCDKSCNTELFTVNTRPHSVRILYEEADATHSSMGSHCHKKCCLKSKFEINAAKEDITILNKNNVLTVENCYKIENNDRKMLANIDAEIEIRLPATFEDLRKWTSSEVLGDVTVTPDCMHHVNTFLNTSSIVAANIEEHASYVKPPSFTSHDLVDDVLLPDTINANVPLNHRLPSPEEQCKTIALKYPAEIVPVDISGRGFRRMCSLRSHPRNYLAASVPTGSNLQTELETIKRRSRSLRVKTKRRNTIAGTDQKELSVAANRVTDDKAIDIEQSMERKSKKFGRSKSSDVLKKDCAAFPYDKGKNTLTRFNALKQWGRNRLKVIQRNNNDSNTPSIIFHGNDNDCSNKIEKSQNIGDDEYHSRALKEQNRNENRLSKGTKALLLKSPTKNIVHCQNIEMPSKQHPNVQLRDTTCLNRLRHNVFLNNCNEDQPHSSSGNWSASSESGRTSIGSEITPIPKSSASNTSLNTPTNCQTGSTGTPFLIFTRRKFLNTSASNSITSESTLTPELAIGTTNDNAISNQLNDDETSSAYSCDTEGYYTSFHMDSGLRTLKEEDIPVITIQSDNSEQNLKFSNHLISHNSSINNSELTLIVENDYELFGHGSTSTTTSSAGTVCTTLRNKNNSNSDKQNTNRSMPNGGHELIEIARSAQSANVNSTSTIAEEENYVILDKNGSIENSREARHLNSHSNQKLSLTNSMLNNEIEYSGSSDLESVERIERIKQKTVIRSKHIPSMCIITPSTSDDENLNEQNNNNSIDYKRIKDLRNKSQEQFDSNEKVNKMVSTSNTFSKNTDEWNLGAIQCDNEKLLQGTITPTVEHSTELNKQEKKHSIQDTYSQKRIQLNASTNSEMNSLDNISFAQKTQSPPRTAHFPIEESTHVRLRTPKILESDVNVLYSQKKCNASENENESNQSPLPLTSESNHLNRKELHRSSDSTCNTNKNTNHNFNDSTISISKSLQASQLMHTETYNTNEIFKNSFTSSFDQKDQLRESNQPTFHQQKQQQQQQMNSLQNVDYSTPVKTKDEYKTNIKASGSTFNRDSSIYWTLQNKKYNKQPITSTRLTCRDDSYSINDNIEDTSSISNYSGCSPIAKGKNNAFLSSTLKTRHTPDNQLFTSDLSSVCLNTCADRIGKTKTSLMDFKKLLLAKSIQTNVLPKKMSAVELLKKSSAGTPVTSTLNNDNSTSLKTKQPITPIDKNMKLLRLNGSPKKFANRRMLRQGQFGMPSQSLSPKSNITNVWDNNSRTDIISTVIPEVHGEIDSNVNVTADNNVHNKRQSKVCPQSIDPSNIKSESNEVSDNNDRTITTQTVSKPTTIPTLETAL